MNAPLPADLTSSFVTLLQSNATCAMTWLDARLVSEVMSIPATSAQDFLDRHGDAISQAMTAAGWRAVEDLLPHGETTRS